MKNWTDDIKTEDLPVGLLDIARLIGIEPALALAEKFGGGNVYLPQATSVISSAKQRFILKNPGKTVKELRMLTGYSDRQIIRIRQGEPEPEETKQQSFA